MQYSCGFRNNILRKVVSILINRGLDVEIMEADGAGGLG